MNDRRNDWPEPADPGEPDPARRFLDQTVPREDYWEGREPEDGPARPRHIQHPVEPEPLPDPRERRKQAIRGAAWTFGPAAGYLAASAAFGGSAQADPAPDPDPPSYDDPGYGGEIGSGL
jgi:hypothetical protein